METQQIPGGVCAAKGFKASGVHCGFRHNTTKKDLALIVSEAPCSAAAVYTTNKVKGAPLLLTKQHLAGGTAQAILCNSGNANTCNPNGMEIAAGACELAAKATGLAAEDIVVASTGVIGQPMSLNPFEAGVPKAAAALSEAGGTAAGEAIMTTDTVCKEIALKFELGGKPCHIGAIGKGSGMINPNMATMLIFITTDAAIAPALLQKALSAEVKTSLNQIYIDGDTSTNDMAVLLANGMAGNAPVEDENADYAAFCTALHEICVWMARAIAADGEGATKLMEIHVAGAPNEATALLVAKTVAGSDLLKAAMFGEDANWGRVLCAIGYTPGDFSIDNVSVKLESRAGSVHVCENAAYHPYSEEEAAKVLAEKEITIAIDLGLGNCTAEAYGCDLTYDYVKINGDYRT